VAQEENQELPMGPVLSRHGVAISSVAGVSEVIAVGAREVRMSGTVGVPRVSSGAPDRYTATALHNSSNTPTGPTLPSAKSKTKWTKDVNKIVIECYLRSKPKNRGYRKRLLDIWNKKKLFSVSEQQLAGQALCIRNRGWLTAIEIEEIERKISNEDTSPSSNIPIRSPISRPLRVTRNRGNLSSDSSDSDTTCDEDSRSSSIESVHSFSSTLEQPSAEQLHILETLKTFARSPSMLDPVNLKTYDRMTVKIATQKVNSVIKTISSTDIGETNSLILAGANTVAQIIGKKKPIVGKPKEPAWKIRIQNNISIMRRHISQLTATNSKKDIAASLETKYKISSKGLPTVVEELKQRVKSEATKLRKYEQRDLQFRQNRLFQTNQRLLYSQLECQSKDTQATPDSEESKTFWSSIWSTSAQYNTSAKWLNNIDKHVKNKVAQDELKITIVDLKNQLRKMANWKANGTDNVHAYWLKNFTSLHKRICHQLNSLVKSSIVPPWMTSGRTFLIQKDPKKGNEVSNFRPITCLPLMWKLFTGIMANSIYSHLDQSDLFPVEQKGCRRNTKGTKDQLLIDKLLLQNCKRRHTNLSVCWIDYKKAFDMVPHSWILNCLSKFKIAKNIRAIIENSMSNWRTQLTSNQHQLGEVNINRGIFQGDSLSPILFILSLIPLSLVLNKTQTGYSLGNSKPRVNHLLFMDDLKLYAKNQSELDSLVQSVRLFSDDIKMEFGISKCAHLQIEHGKVTKSEGIRLPNKTEIKSLDAGDSYKYLGILQSDKTHNNEMKSNLTSEYRRRIRVILRSGLNGKNTIQAINARAVSLIRYGAGIVQWTQLELKQLDSKTRKLLTIYRSMHPQDDVDRLYLPRKDGGRGLLSIESTVALEINNLGFYCKQSQEPLLREVLRADIKLMLSENPQEAKHKSLSNRKDNFLSKKLHPIFYKTVTALNISEGDSWLWLKKGYLKKETEGLILAAQNQALRSRWVQHNIDKIDVSPKCRMCGERDETIAHIVSECSQLAQNDYKNCRHDKVAAILHWQFCKSYGFDHAEKSYNHFVDKNNRVLENDSIKLLWDFSIQTQVKIDHNKPDIVVVDKEKRLCHLIDVACPFDSRVDKKEKEKFDHYTDLKFEILKCWSKEIDKVKITPIVIGALGTVSKNHQRYMFDIGIPFGLEVLQKTCLLGTARILRKVLSFD
jgi:hypothetical protein